MRAYTVPDVARRSSRVSVNVPILVTSLAPGAHFSEICETLVVSAHGCSMRSPMKLEAGVPIHFHSKDGRETTAEVVDCQPMGANQPGWKLAARLEQPDNFWGLKSCPEDWAKLVKLSSGSTRKPVGDKFQQQLSEDKLRTVISEFVQPLHADVAELKSKLSRGEPRRSQFEVSLSHIPPELEEKLWTRLRQDLSAQAQHQLREQSEKLLASTQAAIDKKITDGQEEFRRSIKPELQAVEQRAQSISADMANRMRQHLGEGLGEFQKQVAEERKRLDQWNQQMVQNLEKRLGEQYETHRWEMQQIQTAASAEASRLQAQVSDLSGRMAKLDESARRLESELEGHLERMAADIVSDARSELKSAVESLLKEMHTRNEKELGKQLDDACSHLKIIQKGIEASASDLMKTQVKDTLKSFEHSMEELAQHSVERWRRTLAGGLNSLVKTLGEQLRLEPGE
jgi:hypothetical protein